jgi:hypothetical protein
VQRIRSILLCVGLSVLGACSSLETHRNPQADLSHLKRFYVERRLSDDHHVDEAIVDGLKALGFEASSGPLTMMPDGVDALVSYEDVWAWDFKTYLIQLNIGFENPNSGRPLAAGTYRQPSVITKEPSQVVRQILRPLFQRKIATALH